VAVCLALACLYAGLDWAVETDREQVQHRVEEMAAAVGRNDLDGAFRYVSERFVSPGGRTKVQFQDLARSYRRSAIVTEIVVWEFEFPEPLDRSMGRGKVSFLVKVRGDLGRTQHLFARCQGLFEFRAGAGWQLRSFELFDPARSNERVPFPY
jgi:hypothetical protein